MYSTKPKEEEKPPPQPDFTMAKLNTAPIPTQKPKDAIDLLGALQTKMDRDLQDFAPIKNITGKSREKPGS